MLGCSQAIGITILTTAITKGDPQNLPKCSGKRSMIVRVSFSFCIPFWLLGILCRCSIGVVWIVCHFISNCLIEKCTTTTYNQLVSLCSCHQPRHTVRCCIQLWYNANYLIRYKVLSQMFLPHPDMNFHNNATFYLITLPSTSKIMNGH